MAKTTILFLAANPTTTNHLALGEEARDIETELQASPHREALVLQTKWATRTDDLRRSLNHDRPVVVHFSGHGCGSHGIVLNDERDGERLVTGRALQRLFKAVKDDIRVVVLNACYTTEQASAIVEVIDCVVGMKDSIGDAAARKFSAGFYGALASRRSVGNAFEQGLAAIALDGLGDEDVPVLLVRDGVDASAVWLVGLGDGDSRPEPDSISQQLSPTPDRSSPLVEATGYPVVWSVEPVEAYLGEMTVFTIRGKSLPPTLTAWIHEGEDLHWTYKSADEARFECRPSHTEGSKAGSVKDRPGGNEVQGFQVHVHPARRSAPRSLSEQCSNSNAEPVPGPSSVGVLSLEQQVLESIVGDFLDEGSLQWVLGRVPRTTLEASADEVNVMFDTLVELGCLDRAGRRPGDSYLPTAQGLRRSCRWPEVRKFVSGLLKALQDMVRENPRLHSYTWPHVGEGWYEPSPSAANPRSLIFAFGLSSDLTISGNDYHYTLPEDIEALLSVKTAEELVARRSELYGDSRQDKLTAANQAPEDILSVEYRTLFKRGLFELAQGDPGTAAALFLACLIQQPHDVYAGVNLAQAHKAAGDFDEAERVVLKLIAEDPSFGPAWRVKADIENLTSRYKEGFKSAQRAFDLMGPMSQVFLALAYAAVNIDIESGLLWVERARHESVPFYDYAIEIALGDAFALAGRLDDADGVYTDLIECIEDIGAPPPTNSGRNLLADALYGRGAVTLAQALEERSTKKLNQAVDQFHRALAKDYDSLSIRLKQAEAFRYLGKFQNAIEALKPASAHNTPEWRCEYGLNLLGLGRFADAAENLLEASRLPRTAAEPDLFELAVSHAAVALMREGEFAKVVATCDLAIEGGLENAVLLTCRARARSAMDDVEGAKRDFDRAAEGYPEDPVVKANIAVGVTGRGHPDAAVQLLEQALVDDPTNPGIWVGLFHTLRVAGRIREALALAERVSERFDDSPDVLTRILPRLQHAQFAVIIRSRKK